MKLNNSEALQMVMDICADYENPTEDITALNDWAATHFTMNENSRAKERARRAEKKAAAGPDELTEAIKAVLKNATEAMSITQIMKQLTGDPNSQLVTSRLTDLVKAGVVVKNTVNVPKTEDAAARSYKTYQLA